MSDKTLIAGAIILSAGLLFFGRVYSGAIAGNTNSHTGARGQANVGSAANSQLAPDFSLAKLGGGTITLSEFRGKKPVVVDFWASWCQNCRRDMPNLNRYYEKYKDKVEVIGVNLQEPESKVKDFFASRGISFPIAFDPSGQASRAYGIQYTNTHFLINKKGNLVRQIPGDIGESDIISLISSSAEALEDKEQDL